MEYRKVDEVAKKIYSSGIAGELLDSKIRKQKKALTIYAQEQLNNWNSNKTSGQHDELFQVIDFFSGCGGMTLGFAALSRQIPLFRVVGGVDIDESATNSFQHNMNAPGVDIDIQDLVDDDVALNNLLDRMESFNNDKPLIVIGCPPCQGFTSHRKKNWANDDERNSLVGAFASIAVRLNPIAIVMENVPDMLAKKYWKHFEQARKIFTQSGYIVHQSIYNSATFDVPQERFRSIVLALKKEFMMPEPIIDNPNDFLTVRQAIGQLPKVKPGEPHPKDKYHRSAKHRGSTIETIRAVRKDGGSRPKGVGPKCLDRIKGFSDVYGRLYWDKPAITITHYARNPASGRYVHPEQDRGLTMREAALLQSFPSGFEFFGTFDSVFKQIGEAVPPKLACGIAANLLVELLSPEPTNEELDCGVKSILRPVSNSYSSVIAGLKSSRTS